MHTYSNANVRAARYGQPTTRHTFHIFNQQRSTHSRHQYCSVFGHHVVKVKSRPHTALKTTDAFKFKLVCRQQYKRTACSFRVNKYTTRVRRTKINAESQVPLQCICATHDDSELSLRTRAASNTNNTVKLELKRNNENLRTVDLGPTQ